MAKKVIIIGAGLGGLSAAIRLAHYGYDVEIFEQSCKPGGKAGEIYENGFRFDTGPSLLTMPFVIKQLFDDVGENIEDYLEILPLKSLCKYFWRDGTVINAYSELNKFSEEIEKKTKDEDENLQKYFTYSRKIYELTANLFLFSSFSSWRDFANISALKTLLQIWKIDPFRTMHQANSSFFRDKKLVQLFDRYATYNGSNPYKAPATLNIIPHVEYYLGAYIPMDGIYSIVESMFKLAKKKGVKFNFNAKVHRILTKDNKIYGINVERENKEEIVKSEIVISNSDVNYTYQKLLQKPELTAAKKYKDVETSSSALVFYWGVKGIYPSLECHNILFSSDYRKEFEDLSKKIYNDDPTVYIYISSKYKKDDAPEGFENWYVMINAPHITTDFDGESDINAMRQIITDKIESTLKIDLDGKIITEQIMTPLDIEKETSSYLGGLYGIASNSRNAAFLRQKNRSKDLKGLYFCGGSAHPGGGIPLVILSGKNAAEQIMRYEN
jgi:phytoene desaturase